MDGDQTRYALQGRRILIVEDESLLALDLVILLRGHGCVVIGPAYSLEQALGLVEAERPDAAVLDLNLDGESAIPLAATLSAQAVPFVVVSGYSRALMDEPVLQQAPRLDKPVNRSALVSALTQLVRAGSP